MSETFQNLTQTNENLFFRKNDRNDLRLGEIVPNVKYAESNIVIVGCPQDEGVRRSNGRLGAALAPDAIRKQFYQLTPFGIQSKLCDLGNLEFRNSLEETHDNLSNIVKQILEDGKKLIVLGGGNDISYPNGRALAEVFGAGNWIGVNVDGKFDVAIAEQINNETAYRRLLDEKLIRPDYLYQIGYQTHFASPIYYRYLQDLRVNLSSLEQIRSRETADLELREMMRQKFIGHSQSLNTFFGFDLTVVRSTDAPGTTNPSPLGLRAGEFIQIVKLAASLSNTKIIQFSEVNPNFDEDDRTTKLTAIAMHRFCSNQK
jgi:formiminoglutamase